MSEGARLRDLSIAIRESTLDRLRRVPRGREGWRPCAGALSFGDLAAHLADADRWLFRKLRSPQLRGMVAVAGAKRWSRPTFERAVTRLEELGRRRAELLARLDRRELDRELVDDRFGGHVTVWWVIVRGNLDHEIHHRGQLATYLRLLGAADSNDGGAP